MVEMVTTILSIYCDNDDNDNDTEQHTYEIEVKLNILPTKY